MWGAVLEQLAKEYGVCLGFLVYNGNYGQFQKPLNAWDHLRLSTLERWKPQLTLYFDFWAGDFPEAGPYWYYPAYDFEYALGLLAARSERVMVFADVPTLPVAQRPSNDGLKRYVYRRFQETGGFGFLVNMREDAAYKARRLATQQNIKRARAVRPPCRLAGRHQKASRIATGRICVWPCWPQFGSHGARQEIHIPYAHPGPCDPTWGPRHRTCRCMAGESHMALSLTTRA